MSQIKIDLYGNDRSVSVNNDTFLSIIFAYIQPLALVTIGISEIYHLHWCLWGSSL